MFFFASLYNPVRAGNLPPRCVGILRISDQAHGTSTGYPAKLMGIYANEETILAKFFNCAKYAVGPLTLRKLNTLTKLVLHMEDAEEISTIIKYI